MGKKSQSSAGAPQAVFQLTALRFGQITKISGASPHCLFCGFFGVLNFGLLGFLHSLRVPQ